METLAILLSVLKNQFINKYILMPPKKSNKYLKKIIQLIKRHKCQTLAKISSDKFHQNVFYALLF